MTPLVKMRYALAFLLVILSTTILAQTQSVDNAEQTPTKAQAGNPLKVPMRIVAYRDPHGKAGAAVGVAAAPAGAHLSYFGVADGLLIFRSSVAAFYALPECLYLSSFNS